MKICFLLVYFLIFSFNCFSQIDISIDEIRNEPMEPYLIFNISIQNTSNGIVQFESPLYAGEYFINYAMVNLIAKTESNIIQIFPYNPIDNKALKISELDPLEKYTTRMIISKRNILDFFEDGLQYTSLNFQIKLNVITNPDSNYRKLIESNWVKTKIIKIDSAITNWLKNKEKNGISFLFYNEFIYPFNEESNFWRVEKNIEYAQEYIDAFPKYMYSDWANYYIITYKYNYRDKEQRNKFENGIKKLKNTKDILLKERIEKQIALNQYYEALDKKNKK